MSTKPRTPRVKPMMTAYRLGGYDAAYALLVRWDLDGMPLKQFQHLEDILSHHHFSETLKARRATQQKAYQATIAKLPTLDALLRGEYEAT